MGCIFPMVIWSEFHIGQFKDDDYRKDSPHFNNFLGYKKASEMVPGEFQISAQAGALIGS